MIRAFQPVVRLLLVCPLPALAAITALGLSPVHAAGTGSLEGNHPPHEVEIDIPDEVSSVVLDGDRAYVARRWWLCFWGCFPASRLTVRDLSPSGTQQLLGSMDFPPGIRRFDVQGGFAYVACNYYFFVVDVSDPTAMHHVGEIPGWPDKAECIAVAGGHAYVGDNNGFHVVDVSDPASPSVVASLALSDRVVSVALDGPRAYVGTLDGRVAVVDVSNPVAPVVVAGIDMPGTPWDIVSRGSHAYVSDGESGLQVLDISSPAQPRLAGGVDTPGNARRIALGGARAYVVDEGSEPPYVLGEFIASRLQVIDVSNPNHPVIVNSIAGVDSIENVGWWVHAEVRAVAANKARVVMGGGLLHTWLEDCIGGPGGCDYSSGYLISTPRVACEAPPPRARSYGPPAAEAGASVHPAPATFALRGNSPNPFGAASSIRFEMPRASHVRIQVYDVRGRLVKTLVDDVFEPGRHETIWRGRAENGEAAPSGIYFVTMEAESFRQTSKITLLR